MPPENNTLLGQIKGLSAQAVGAREVSLAWHPSEMETLKCYSVYRGTAPDGPYDWLASPVETFYYDTGLDQSATYYYYVIAVDYADNSSERALVAVTTRTPVVLELFGYEG